MIFIPYTSYYLAKNSRTLIIESIGTVQRVPLFLLASCSIWVAKQPCLHYLFSLRPWFHTSNTDINVASAPSASSRVFSEHEC